MSSAQGADNYFTNRGSLIEPMALDDINALGVPIQLGTDGRLHRFNNGIWSPDGDAEVAVRLSILLGDKLRIGHVRSIRELMKSGYPTFDLLAPPHPAMQHSICLANGVLDLSVDGMPVLGPHRPELRYRQQIPYEWEPTATCPSIDSFLLSALGDEEVVSLMLEWIGYAMLPALQLKLALLLYSPQPDSGKTTTLNLITSLLGTHNCSAVTLQALDNDRFQRANLDGMLANVAGDLSAEAAVSSSMFKSLLGGDEVTIERKMVQATKMRNTAKLLFAANSLPPTADQEDAYFRRWHIIPFPNQFPYDPAFADTISTKAEMQGLLVKAALGAQRIIHRRPVGFPDPLPMAVDIATSRYRTEADSVVRWLDDDTLPREGNRLNRSEVYKRYQEWSKENGHGALSATKFYRRLERQPGITMGKTAASRYVEGIAFPFPSNDRPAPSWRNNG